LVEFLRARLKRQQLRHGEGHWKLTQLDNVFDPKALTLGFARRFATYKRATLIFHDKERLKRLLNDAERPVQLVFAGKAHPADEYGKALIERIYRLSQEQGFFGKIAIVENYDINVGRHLVSGVDVWLNTPRRPFEASGTSGQKAAINGAPNFSILDGWWREGYDSENGWAIGEEREYKDIDTQDEADALSLYSILEEEVVAEYYDRPADWTRRMRRAIATCGPQFSMRRMLSEYANSLYIPAMDSNRAYREDWGEAGRQVAHWKQHVRNEWQSVYVAVPELPPSQAKIGESIEIEAQVWPGRLSVNDLAVELVTIAATEGEEAFSPGPEQLHPVSSRTVPMHAAFQEQQDPEHHHHDESFCFRGILVPEETGKHSFGVRVRPHHPALIHPLEMGLSAWA
jgi:starch phosphorylase